MSAVLGVAISVALAVGLAEGCSTLHDRAVASAGTPALSVGQAWDSLGRLFPSCGMSLTIDARMMTRRLDELAAPLEPSLLSDAGIDASRYRYFPVCRFEIADAPFVGLIIEGRGGVGGGDEQYRLITRSDDGTTMVDTVIASRSADCSFERTVEAVIVFPTIVMTETYTAIDCERDSVTSRTMIATATLSLDREGGLRIGSTLHRE